MATPTAPTYLVLKFGGTSVASPVRWSHIARLVADHVAAGRHPVVVCSALAGVTDDLVGLAAAVETGAAPDAFLADIWRRHVALATALDLDADAVVGEQFAVLTALATDDDAPSPSWRARVLSCGELMSTKLGAAWLRKTGVDARWTDARTLLRATGETLPDGAGAYLSACCDYAPNAALQARLAADGAEATITQGFIASNHEGETVVLGRGGSDTSAAYLASLLEAERLEIWTDVPGLFTADPRKATGARLLPRVTYDEAAVLGSLGAKVLHPRCLFPVQERGIPLAIRWTDRPDVPGTVIGAGPDFATRGIKSIASRKQLCLIRMRRDRLWQPVGFMSDVSSCFHEHGLSMDLISSSPSEIRATIDLSADPDADDRLPALLDALSAFCVPSLHRDVTCLSITGTGISGEMPRIAAVMQVLGDPTIHLVTHAADDTHVSYVLDARVGDGLIEVVHAAIFGATDETAAMGPSWQSLSGLPDTAIAAPRTASARPATREATA